MPGQELLGWARATRSDGRGTTSALQKRSTQHHFLAENFMKYALLIVAMATLSFGGCQEANHPATNTAPVAVDAGARRDNTEVNVRDRAENAKTPFDQNENKRDIDVTANIRKRVVGTQMSVNAQNVKIITQDGKVTLRGPVQSADEKLQVEKLAQEVAGPGNVVSQLEVQP